jgi:hypothetical protein
LERYAQHFTVSGDTVSLHAKGVTQNNAVCCPFISRTFRWKIASTRRIAQ